MDKFERARQYGHPARRNRKYTICPEGFHNFIIVRADERTSKNNNRYYLLACENTIHKVGFVWEIFLSEPKSPPLSPGALEFVQAGCGH